jgi:hypothetical protein
MTKAPLTIAIFLIVIWRSSRISGTVIAKVRGLTAMMALNSRNHVANISIMSVAAKFK